MIISDLKYGDILEATCPCKLKTAISDYFQHMGAQETILTNDHLQADMFNLAKKSCLFTQPVVMEPIYHSF